jgi:hypothetical protein
MARVLGHPPAKAHAHVQVADQQAGHLAGAPRAEALPVAEIVPEKRNLRAGEGQQRGDGQRPPGRSYPGERDPPGCEQADRVGDLERVVKRAPAQQVGCLNLAYDRMVLADDDDAATYVYTAEPGSETAERLTLLARWDVEPSPASMPRR